MDIRLKLPAAQHAISVGGAMYSADAEQCVNVPEECVAECLRHGLTPVPAADLPKKRGKKESA